MDNVDPEGGQGQVALLESGEPGSGYARGAYTVEGDGGGREAS